MLTGLFMRWDFDSETSIFKPRQSKSRSFEIVVLSCFQQTRPEFEIESFFTAGRQKKNDCFSVDGFCSHCNTLLEPCVAFTTSVPVKSCIPLSLKRIFNVVARRERELDAMRRHYIHEKGFKVIEMWECESWRL